ncbi:MAG: DUF4388 domain-containing protein [Acidimicrobiales bacterium]|nr:DUF4388 domain-containing protein [Acidimicrobiales bacterium]MCB1249100.1 DUF4388 domain-containing protein [Acidimicrobiales bacterium]
MALQGTIETFALPDVLRLLSSTKKTGQLRVDGDRGAGSLWVEEGMVTAGAAGAGGNVTDPGEALFELLRFGSGDFIFEDDQRPDTSGDPTDVEPLLDAATAMLDEWQAIEAVVPSLDHHVSLVTELSDDEVVISAADWKTLVAVAGGSSVGRLGDALGLGELSVSRAVKQLNELGLVEIGEPRAGGDAGAGTGASADDGGFSTFGADAAATLEADEVESFESFDPAALVVDDTVGFEADDAAFGAASDESAEAEPDASDAAEIARQLANLSPKAAKAVAAAARATTPEERDAALAEVDDDEDPINRDLLIKFLGSVNS